MGGGAPPRQQRHQYDGEGEGQAGHALSVPNVLRQSAVCAAAPFLRPGFHHLRRTLQSEWKAELCVFPEQRQQPPPGLLQDSAIVWLQVLHSRSYLETREEGFYWFAVGGAERILPDATAAAAGPGAAEHPG